jgi:hypothetical protein
VNQQRFQELERKRDDVGLSEEEANELGQMIAEQEGQPYSNADLEQEAEAAREAAEDATVRDTMVADSLRREREVNPVEAEPTDGEPDHAGIER